MSGGLGIGLPDHGVVGVGWRKRRPDDPAVPRRRTGDAPIVDIHDFQANAMRRFELQPRRDDNFSYSLFSAGFRDALDQQSYLQARSTQTAGMEMVDADTWREIAEYLKSHKVTSVEQIAHLFIVQ